jgi:hypothetical protein
MSVPEGIHLEPGKCLLLKKRLYGLKHVAIQIHHLRDLIEKKFIEMVYIPTKIQLADVFTKPLAHQVFTVHVDTLFGVPPVEHKRVSKNN